MGEKGIRGGVAPKLKVEWKKKETGGSCRSRGGGVLVGKRRRGKGIKTFQYRWGMGKPVTNATAG